MVSSQATAVACLHHGWGHESPFISYKRSRLGRFFVGELVIATVRLSLLSGKIRCCFVVFFRILRHASHVRWIRLSWIFHTHAVALIILGCSYYFELLSGCALMVLLAAALNPTTPHRTLPSHAGRYCARILSYRQFEYLPSWKYCVVSFSSNYQTRVFYSMVSFHVSFRHIAVARSIHGLRSLSPFTSYYWS